MRIGLVRRGFSATGGAEAYLKRFAGALRSAGHECVLFTSTDWPPDAWSGDDFVYLPGKSPRVFADNLEQVRADLTRNPGGKARCDYLFSMERVWNCDCYRAGDGVHRAWLERRRIEDPVWKRLRHLFHPFNPKHRELLSLEKRLFSSKDSGGAGVVIANSYMVKQEIIRHYGYPADRIHVVYNGVPQHAVDPQLRAQTRRQLGLSEFDYVLLFAGSGWSRKGLRFAIEGVRRANLSRPLLLVAGRGDYRRYPSSQRVQFLGPVKEMDAYYAAADVFILPTIYDPFSNACLEALAAGLPVITTTANGFSEVIHEGVDGEVLDDPSDTEAVARAIEGWAPPDRRSTIKQHLIELASKYTVEANLKGTLEAMGSSLNNQ